MRRFAVLAFGSLLLAVPSAALAFDEPVGGWSNDPLAPSPLPFVVGTNVINGAVRSTAPADTHDFITFTVPVGSTLTGLRVADWTGANRGFHAIDSGATTVLPSGGTQAQLLGGDHLDPDDDGDEVLLELSNGTTDGTPAGSGFTPPLGPGAYSYVIQQTSGTSTYSIEFVITGPPPVPASDGLWTAVLMLGLLATGGLLALRRNKVAA